MKKVENTTAEQKVNQEPIGIDQDKTEGAKVLNQEAPLEKGTALTGTSPEDKLGTVKAREVPLEINQLRQTAKEAFPRLQEEQLERLRQTAGQETLDEKRKRLEDLNIALKRAQESGSEDRIKNIQALVEFWERNISKHEIVAEERRRLKGEGSVLEKIDWWLSDHVEPTWDRVMDKIGLGRLVGSKSILFKRKVETESGYVDEESEEKKRE